MASDLGSGAGDELSVAFICTGNRFRSPLAAAFLGRESERVPLRVLSFGTLGLGAVPALPEAIELARRHGLDLSSHTARAISEVDLEPFDLVLGFESSHVAAAVVEGRARDERTFTLPELVSLLDGIQTPADGSGPVERARARIEQAGGVRGPALLPSAQVELPDPLGRPARVQRKIAARLERLVLELASGLFD